MTTEHPALILVVDDEPPIRRFLRISLEANGFEVVEASSVSEGLQRFTARRPDLVTLDLGLPDGDGITLLEAVRSWSQVPVIALTVRDAEADKIALLDAGADDYVVKPFATGELVARIRAALRRHAQQGHAQDPIVEIDGLRIDLAERRVTLDGEDVHLTRKEFGVLAFLARHAGRIVTHAQLLDAVWGGVHRDDIQYLRVCIQHIRGKLADASDAPRYILTEQGIGYRLRR